MDDLSLLASCSHPLISISEDYAQNHLHVNSGVIRMWSASTGDLLGPFRLPLFDHPNSKIEEYTDTDNAITGLAWSPNGKYLLSGNNAAQVILQVVLCWGSAP